MDLHSFAVAGSFVIFFLALKMILGISLFKEEALEVASIVPLAFTVITGAETIITLLTLRAEYGLVKIIIAILINILIVYIILKSSSRLEKILGKQGINNIRKVFGIIFLAIAVKLFAINAGKIVV